MMKCWAVNPTERPLFREVISLLLDPMETMLARLVYYTLNVACDMHVSFSVLAMNDHLDQLHHYLKITLLTRSCPKNVKLKSHLISLY